MITKKKRSELNTQVIKCFIITGSGWPYKVKENPGVKLGEQWLHSHTHIHTRCGKNHLDKFGLQERGLNGKSSLKTN